MNPIQFLEYLGTPDVVTSVAFLSTVSVSLLEKHRPNFLLDRDEFMILTNPLSTLIGATINGAFVALGASLLTVVIPDRLVPLVPLSLGLASGYQIIKVLT